MAKRICVLPGCERPHYGKGYCRNHWRRLKTHGSATWEPLRQAETCIVDDCGQSAWARDLCSRHYRRLRLYSDPLGSNPRVQPVGQTPTECKIDGCGREAGKRGWCGLHYLRWYRHGDPEWQRPIHPRCVIDGCTGAPRSRYAIMCDTHYCRLRRNGTLEVGQCTVCQEPLPAGSMRSRKYCPDCYLMRRRERGRDQGNLRRALKMHDGAERIDSLEIYERDGWRCGLCRRKVDPRHVWPHSLSPSLDHVIPLVEGGPHVRSNVQLAHLGCNARKRDRGGGEQLMLIG